jgi:endonuclease/exonuclease/phosphatase family metal-dependent hydrolase
MSRLPGALLALALSALLGACVSPADPGVRSVSIMTFNVQNLFDTSDDPGRDDKAYLPLSVKQNAAHRAACNEIEVTAWREECLYLDWNETVLEAKLAAVAKAIRGAGGGPDIIAFQEVENLALLERLRKSHLAGLGYGPAILIEGQDLRGIDVGFLAKLPLIGEPVLHPLEFPAFPEREADTRGVLEATFALPGGGRLTGFAVHFPAPFHPVAMRERAYRHLAELRAALPDENNVFAAGDFNTTSTEADETRILDELVRPAWSIAHESGCPVCRGTYYYAAGDNWSFLDMILYSPARSADATWRLRENSARIANTAPGQRTHAGTPQRFSADDRAGVSDHWPLVVEIEPAPEQ